MSEELDAIYRKIPNVMCRGLCTSACGPIKATRQEVERLEAYGSIPDPPDALTCPLLENGRCSRYADRPLICRLYGAAEGLTCPWGCVPLRVLAPHEVQHIIRQVGALSGHEYRPIHPMADDIENVARYMLG